MKALNKKKVIMKPIILLRTALSALFTTFSVSCIEARSIYRPIDPTLPCIETHWAHDTLHNYTLRSPFLEEYALFKTFNEQFFMQNLLPDSAISYRYDSKKQVTGKQLKQLIDKLVQEILNKQKTFTDFEILCKKDFNRHACSGLVILKCKHYPFVVKLFIENPHSFLRYTSKGFIPTVCFFMSGGINRHLVGFSRVKNLQDMTTLIAQSPEWADKVTFPRKWFVLPSQSQWIEMVGHNIGHNKKQSIKIPGIYGIVADWIEAGRHTSMFNKEDKKTCMSLCNYIGLSIDPHINNFMYEKDTGKIAIIDTEHFLSLVGLKEPMKFTGYFAWGVHLGTYCARRMFFRDKQERKNSQLQVSHTELKYNTDQTTSPSIPIPQQKNIKLT
jgi:hypothetical protein